MATTANLGIEKLNSSDYVSVDGINGALDVLDGLGVDYVTKSGTDGDWWYRCWKSGRAECGIDSRNFGSVNIDTAWGALYASANLSFGAYPSGFAFAANPYVSICFCGSDAGSTGQQSYVAAAASTSTARSPYFRLVDPYSNPHTNVKCGILVQGRWK